MSEKTEKTFYCHDRGHQRYVWGSKDYEEGDDGADYAKCPICRKPTREVPDRYRSLYKGWMNATGPKTQEGKNRVRLNGYKTGEHTTVVHLLAPALPGKFPTCEGCEYREPCENEPYTWCPVNVGPMLRFLKAYQEGSVGDLKDFAGLNQARVFQILQMMFQQIQKHGVLVPKEILHKDGKDGSQKETIEWQANPLLERVLSYLQALGHTAEQQVMTPAKAQDEQNFIGYLQMEGQRTEAIEERLQKNLIAMQELKGKIQLAKLQRAQDEAMLRHAEQVAIEEQKKDDPSKE